MVKNVSAWLSRFDFRAQGLDLSLLLFESLDQNCGDILIGDGFEPIFVSRHNLRKHVLDFLGDQSNLRSRLELLFGEIVLTPLEANASKLPHRFRCSVESANIFL